MNKHGQIKDGSSPFKCRAYPSGSKKREKAKGAKMTEEEVAAKSRNTEVTVLQWQCRPAETFLEILRGQKIEEHVGTDVLRSKDENRLV